MSRQPIGKGERVTIILNPAFPKERLILDYLNKSLNRSADIKEVLYNYVFSQQLSKNDKSISNDCSMDDNSITKECVLNDNLMINELSKNGDSIINKSSLYNKSKNNDFLINLNNVEDEEMVVEHNEKEEIEDANAKALDFLKNGF